MAEHEWKHLAHSDEERARLAEGARERFRRGDWPPPELTAWERYRERKRRGTRVAIDWQYNFRSYLMASMVPMLSFFGGLDLLSKDPLWQKASGVLLLLATAAGAALLVRYLMLPVDAASRRAREEFYESTKWRNIWKDIRGKDAR